MHFLLSLSLLCALVALAFGQALLPEEGADKGELQPVQPGSAEFNLRLKNPCNSDFRNFDGTCTNPTQAKKHLWGSTNRPQFSYFGKKTDTSEAKGTDLPSARELSNILCRSSSDVFDARGLSEMATFFGQFVDHTLTATPTNKKEPLPIKIPEDDVFFANKSVGSKAEIGFFRSVRVKVSKRGPERPSNTLTSAVDLDSVYGPSKKRFNALATGRDGLLKTSAGDLMPLNGMGRNEFNNAPPDKGNQFFLAGDHRSNEHPVLTSLHTLFLREHNDIAREVKDVLGAKSDREIFEIARKVNVAQMQNIVFNIWYPAVTGRQLPRYRKFKKGTDPTVSLVFSTAAFRVGHTMVGNAITRAGPGNSKLPSLAFTEMFFKTAAAFRQGKFEEFLRGAMVNRAQKIDLEIRDSLRNFLFENVDGEDGFDLMAFNIQRGRDHALPTYNQIRQKFIGNKANSFKDISSNPTVQSNLATAYGTPDKVEAIIGLFAEDLAPGSSMGRTMLAVWEGEFARIRDGDSFYYLKKNYFTDREKTLPRVQKLLTGADTFKDIVLRNSDVTEAEYPRRSFFFN